MTLYFLLNDTKLRRHAIHEPAWGVYSFLFYGMLELQEDGLKIEHNLQENNSRLVRKLFHIINGMINHVNSLFGGYGGDWMTILSRLPAINRAEIVVCSADRLGLPLMLLHRLGWVSPPVIYLSIGLPDRLQRLRSRRMEELYRQAILGASAIICFGYAERENLAAFLGSTAPVQFLPFGAVTGLAENMNIKQPAYEIFSVGFDPNRDFNLLVEYARQRPDCRICIATNPSQMTSEKPFPQNLIIQTDVTPSEVLS